MMKDGLELIDAHFQKEGISRRDALKLFGTGGAAALMATGTTGCTGGSSNAKGKILIVGGGLAGMSTAARLTHYLSNPDITVIEPNEYATSYQPGQTLVGGGVWKKEELVYKTADYVPEGVTWIKEKAVEFDPENNTVTTSDGKKIQYDYMIVAAGLKLDFSQIEGLGINETITSAGDASAVSKIIGKNGLASIYFQQGSEDTWKEMQKFIAEAKSGKKVKGVFTHPATAIKCGGAPKKIMYLTDARLREAGARENAELTFYPNGGNMFGIPEYHDAIVKQFEARDMKWNYHHNLVAVDPEKKIATFDHFWEEKGAWDEDLEEYTMETKHENVEVPYDFLHITPPMIAPEEIAKSPIGSSQGWVPVVKETLQHVKFKNVFALGDIAAVPMGKTGGSARKQYKVVVENLISVMEGKEPKAQYGGYTVCPLITGLDTVMLAEFDWSKKPTPSFPLDPTKERYIWWLLKVYALKPMTQYGMLSGRA
ncbi:FAD/NAD(P)-binding oxidoreductase [Sulfurovum sp. zt1-1]|uniref:FAD/NAD(P)-binding oxidoreductase n=2 Tax=Sulfurovum zhangzhouensis TaxID=3019067 RepID=A0ABT7R0H0_9BACT|nr:FAD/NAD(P)-binding oxidoreductase [Sulfurovum zhangzhouensis]MDM5272594.1 FAD/NAD(P)-binding oxidoreductase [Sulfurovum zhangzhouensis]